MKKIVLFVILALVVVLLIFRGVPAAINIYLNKNAEKIVTDMIIRTPDFGDHTVEFGHILFDFNFRGTFLELGGIRITPNENIPKDKIKINLALENAYLTGFSWTSFYLDNSIMLDSAYLENVQVETKTPPFDSLQMSQESEVEGENYDNISINRIRFNRLSFMNVDSYNDSVRMSINDLTVSANHFELSSADIDDRDALFKVGLLEGYLDMASYHFNEYRNAFYFKDLSFNSDDKHLLIGGMQLDNKLERYKYINQFDFQTDWIELDEGELDIQGFNFETFFRKGIVQADLIIASDLVINVFRDKRKPENKERRPEMVQARISGIPREIMIEELKLENAYVAYQERPDTNAPRAGAIHFDEINASISNITNIDTKVAENNIMEVKASGKIMAQGTMDLTIDFTLDDPDGAFHMKGVVGSMPLEALNDMIGPETRVGINAGHLDNLFFNIYANNMEGTGDLIMKYRDLKIKILDKNYKDNQNIFRKAGAFLANTLVVPNDNPKKNGELAEGQVFARRDPSKFIFSYWWELLLSGMMSTLTGKSEADMRADAQADQNK
ncbi:hypothetical protein EL17_19555 [Anditalea andensis]|uniref:DUF748 domain-containing protein n=1 Tax=Anditalea andensis TaxID=1048983 RepID=A0A074KTA3_9BACT|nr:hypothetical protein EL17_19555 [Anditalea andensis]